MSDEDSFEFEEDEDAGPVIGVIGSVSVKSEYVAVTVEKPGGGMDDFEDPEFSEDSQFEVKEVEEAQEVSSRIQQDIGKPEEVLEEASGHPQVMDSPKDSNQGTIEELLRLPETTSPRQKELRKKEKPLKRRSGRKPKDTHEEVPLSGLPVLNRDTENKDTYDSEFLLDPYNQKQAKAGHRFATNSEMPVPVKAAESSNTDFIRKNIEDTLRQKTTPMSPSNESLSVGHLLPNKKVHRVQSPDFVERLYSYRDQVQEKVKKTKAFLIQKEKEICTFSPAVTTRSTQRQRRNPEDLYYEAISRAKDNEQKAERLREELQTEPNSFRPTLNPKSLQMLEKRGRDNTPVHEKLYSAQKVAMRKQIQGGAVPRSKSVGHDEELTFRPVINKRSEGLSRGKQVEDTLYEDAQRRLKRLNEVPNVHAFEQKLISKNSERVLVTKFEEEFRSVWGQVAEGQLIGLDQLKKLLQALHFQPVKGLEKPVKMIWESLEGEQREGIQEEHLLTFLKAVMRFYSGSKSVPDQGIVEGRFGRFEKEAFLLSAKDVQRMHKAFEDMYEARLAVVNKSNLNPHYQSLQTFPFKPDISKSARRGQSTNLSRSGSISSLRSERVEGRLLAAPQRIKAKIQQAKEALEKKKLAECTFRPTVKKSKYATDRKEKVDENAGSEDGEKGRKPQDRNLALYRLAKVVQARREKLTQDYSEIEVEKRSSECTFTPSIDLSEYSPLSAKFKDEGQIKAEGYDETIQRMRKAREERERLRLVKERGEPSEFAPGEDFRHGIERTFKGVLRKSNQDEGISQRPATLQPSKKRTANDTPKSPPREAAPTQSLGTNLQWGAEEVMRKLQAIPQNEVMTVSVNVRPGVAEDLTLYEGDDLMSVVTEFAKKHGIVHPGLSQDDTFKLRSLISAQLLGKD